MGPRLLTRAGAFPPSILGNLDLIPVSGGKW